jgi:Zn-finger nucleic acid-binding protein
MGEPDGRSMMKCPRCGIDLKDSTNRGIEVNACPGCEGMWLDFDELDALEDQVLQKDELKGTTIFASSSTDLSCAKCGQKMKRFKYRLYDLELDYCAAEHGFWLDKGEEKRVLELMQEEVKRLGRKFEMENNWGRILRNLKSKSFFSKLKDLF